MFQEMVLIPMFFSVNRIALGMRVNVIGVSPIQSWVNVLGLRSSPGFASTFLFACVLNARGGTVIDLMRISYSIYLDTRFA